MKKYKLKKDLPLVKVGEYVYTIEDNFSAYISLYMWGHNFKVGFINKKSLDEWLEEVPIEKQVFGGLKEGHTFYEVYSTYVIEHKYDYSDSNDKILESGNAFLTREEAEKELKKRQAIQRIKKYCWENNIDLADNEYIKNTKNLKWFIKYILERKIFEKESERWVYCNYIFCFKNEADIEKVINNCQNDLKIIFDV